LETLMHGFELEARSGDIPVDYNKLRNLSCLGLVSCGQKIVSNSVPMLESSVLFGVMEQILLLDERSLSYVIQQ
jgi:hypothetical protein